MLQNIWQHPKTSLAGVLLCIVTVAGVLSQQGITLGNAGTGTVVTLIGALGTALLGLLSKDPGAQPDSARKVGAVLLCAALLPLSLTAGCTASQVDQVVQKISAYLPTAMALLQDALTIYAAVGAQPAQAQQSPAVVALATVQTDLKALEKPLADYLAASSKSAKATAWTNVEALVDTAAADADALMQIAAVKNQASQAAGVVAVTSLDAAVHVLDGYVASTQTPAQVQARMARRALKLRQVSRYWNPQDRQRVAAAFGMPFGVALRTAEARGM